MVSGVEIDAGPVRERVEWVLRFLNDGDGADEITTVFTATFLAVAKPKGAGLSPQRPIPASGGPSGSIDRRRTVAMYAASWHSSRSSSVAGSGAMPGSAPTDRRRSIPGPKRSGVSGWPGPKS